MKIIIDNKVIMDQDIDMIHEEAQGDYKEKGDFSYLIYTNSEKERLVLKFNDISLSVTRFGTPQTTMLFKKDAFAAAQIPSPLGLQRLVTKTTHFKLQKQARELTLYYQLLSHPEAETALADYQMRLRWLD